MSSTIDDSNTLKSAVLFFLRSDGVIAPRAGVEPATHEFRVSLFCL